MTRTTWLLAIAVMLAVPALLADGPPSPPGASPQQVPPESREGIDQPPVPKWETFVVVVSGHQWSHMPDPPASGLVDAIARTREGHAPLVHDYAMVRPTGERQYEAQLVPLEEGRVAVRHALCLQRVPEAGGAPARHDAGREELRLRPRHRDAHAGHEFHAAALPAALPHLARHRVRRPERGRAVARRVGVELRAVRARLRGAVRPGRWRDVHPGAAGGEPDGCRAARTRERLRGQPLSARRDARGAGLRLGDPGLRGGDPRSPPSGSRSPATGFRWETRTARTFRCPPAPRPSPSRASGRTARSRPRATPPSRRADSPPRSNTLLRRHAAGNFAELLHDISRDPAMLEYLDNKSNRKGLPNENYASEVMELFTMGAGKYAETDIKEAARPFTGWTVRGNRFVFNRRDHDDGEKLFLGERGSFDGDDILNIILRQKGTADFIAGKIFRAFAHDAPSPEVVSALGRTLRDSGYEMRPMLRQLLLSREFYGPPPSARRSRGRWSSSSGSPGPSGWRRRRRRSSGRSPPRAASHSSSRPM